MPLSAPFSSRSLADDVAQLRAHIEMLGSAAPHTPDLFLVEMLRRLNASDVITVAELVGLPPGSPHLIQLYKTWIEVHGGSAEAVFAIWYNLGIQYGFYGDSVNQIISYKNALAAKPDLYQAALNLGLTYEGSGRQDLAIALWQQALQPNEARTSLLNHSGRVLENLKRLDEAEAKYTASLLTSPNQADVLHHWIGLRTRMCCWPIYTSTLPGVSYEAMLASTRALTMLALFDDSALQAQANLSWISEKMPPAPEKLTDGRQYGHKKLRIGYLSSDLCMHPIAYLVAELFELHDRDKFEIYGYCSTKEDGSEVRQRVLRSFDTYVDIRGMDDQHAARLIRAHEIDVLIDLNGLTLGTRLQILRWKPAPIQMTYLGYNGPIPLPELDYIIADEFVIPRDKAETYHPKPLYMPRCYQVNDSKLPIATPPSREEAGLPTNAFIFCSFCNTYKVTEPVFDAWMEILARAEGSVLWLFVDNTYAKANLRARALRAGIAEARVIFASRVDPAQYRGRLALADLFLDTYPYNAGTTASDALRVGLPLITMSGESFTARMAGGILTTMGLEDGIVHDEAAYVDLAVAYATDPARYKAFRDRVTPERWMQTLGDTPRFCRELETALAEVVSALDS